MSSWSCAEDALGAVAVFLLAAAVLERAEAAQLALDRDALRVGQLDDLLRHADVVVEVGRRLAVLLQRAVHHHRREAVLDRALAGGRAVAVVLVHGDRNLRIQLGGGEHQVPQVGVLRSRSGRRARPAR